MLTGKKIVVGVCGGIAAFKAAALVSRLGKLGAEVKVIMTRAATEFVTPLTFQSLSKNPVAVDMFEEPKSWEIRHIALAQWADLFLLAPATANIIGKLAGGIADDMLSTTVMATHARVVIAPAMNTAMFHNPVVQANLQKLQEVLGYTVVAPGSGLLACGDVGDGRLPDTDVLVDAAVCALAPKDLADRRILVTAGPTVERLDPVRYLTNHSSGKMGYAIARAACHRGADVTLVSGPVHIAPPQGVVVVPTESARDMLAAVTAHFPACDTLIMAAAVGDFRPAEEAAHKRKKADGMDLALVQNPDILLEVAGLRQPGQRVVGFCMETEELLPRAQEKLRRKGLDLMVANSLTEPGAGFGVDTNTVTILTPDGETESLPNLPKYEVANRILDRLV